MTEAEESVLDLECQLPLIELATANIARPASTGIDLFIDGFWAGVDALAKPRDRDELETAIHLHRARAAGLIK